MARLAMALLFLLFSAIAAAQDSTLPDGSQTRWVVEEPQEIVAYVAFDPVTVKRELPPRLRFVELREIAMSGIPWAIDYLAKHPAEGDWGISFFEIVRFGTFTIDGRAPHWPKGGAAALWFARVVSSDPAVNLGPGRPYLALEFLMPDKAYVAYMRKKGYYAGFGHVKLLQESDGTWQGMVKAAGLSVTAACIPAGGVIGGAGSAGAQEIFPPLSFSVENIVRVAFTGHREQDCGSGSSLEIRGDHALADGTALEPMVFEYGYSLSGGTYPE
ncbi:MAG: hypothetical protein ABSF75_14535 [Terracidiphilus sp.]|jgi:hypothetical protein